MMTPRARYDCAGAPWQQAVAGLHEGRIGSCGADYKVQVAVAVQYLEQLAANAEEHGHCPYHKSVIDRTRKNVCTI